MEEKLTLSELLFEHIDQKPRKFGDHQERSYPVSAIVSILDKYTKPQYTRINQLEANIDKLVKGLETIRSMSCNVGVEKNRKIRFFITELLSQIK